LDGAGPVRAVHGRWLHDLLDQLIETSRLRPAARKTISELLLRLILERAREDLRRDNRISPAERKYEDCRRYLTDNYLRIRRLSDAARDCGLSAVHLSRLFRRFAAESPHAFLARTKMNHAAELIARDNSSVKAAGAQVGYDDPYHFSRVFKRVHGVAPSRFSTLLGR
jgi:AraC-like DNA-binding protein